MNISCWDHCHIAFGIVRVDPRLPADWRWISRMNEWLQVRAPDGTFYFGVLGDDHKLYKLLPLKFADAQDVERSHGKLKLEQMFLQSDEPLIPEWLK